MIRPAPPPLAAHWALDPGITFLNHGAFGACPREVLALQTELRARMERDPIDFLTRAVEPLLDEARARLGAFLHADPDDLAFVDNATTGVNTVLRSLPLRPGDELLTTDHAYNACANALRAVAEAAGARVVVAAVPFPLRGPEEVSAAVLGAVTPRTRLVLLDHVTSATGVLFPLETLVPALQAKGVDVLVDGAHAPGM
ncbi:MAG TPA: aminotransferase class V-fold PLP-dependent enzyme, partial [Myxococcaceae bacterium]|nr:aminotransferase class V-fold PLP-dependent enzyme [Myxococcaceae bacterium]